MGLYGSSWVRAIRTDEVRGILCIGMFINFVHMENTARILRTHHRIV